jgi:alpha-beta hydrolase superfamily lysophospholipase
MNPHLRHELLAADDHRIPIRIWVPQKRDAPSAILQVLHGLGEHSGRYSRFAGYCCEHGLAVVAHDHRGHGVACEPSMLGHFADRQGWEKVVSDAVEVQRFAAQQWPAKPLALFGHSMGSFIAQSVVAREPGKVSALVLSASTFGPRAQLRLGRALARLVILSLGGRAKSPLLNRLGIGNLNRRFAPNRTTFDWLSRDEVEVDRYIADPLCGFPLSNRLWYDLLGGMLEVMSLRRLRCIPASMPILITGGENDPLGGWRGQGRLAEAFVKSGHAHVELKLYPGGRHEMLNETNRDEFTQNLLGWIERR